MRLGDTKPGYQNSLRPVALLESGKLRCEMLYGVTVASLGIYIRYIGMYVRIPIMDGGCIGRDSRT